MTDAARKSIELQAQVRRNAGEYQSSLKELYNWEKEIKGKEQELQKRPTEEEIEMLKKVPIRSCILEQPNNKMKPNKASVAKETDKNDIKPQKPRTQEDIKRSVANDIKDRGNKCVKLGDYKQAISEYTRAIEFFDNDPIFYSNRALCHLKLENYNECIEDCERALKIDSKAVKAIYRRMQANENLGNNMDALKDCTTILLIEPTNIEAKRSLERINQKLRQNAKAPTGATFTASCDDLIDILPFDKPPYKRSTKPLCRVPVTDVVGPKDNKNFENSTLKISDEDIDKIFNSNCGPYIEIKRGSIDSPIKTACEPEVEKKPKLENTTTKQVSQAQPVAEKNVDKIEKEKQNAFDALKAATVKTNVKETKTPLIIEKEAPQVVERALPPPPTCTAEFYTNWKELSAAQKYQYLKSIKITYLCKILGASFDSDILTDVLCTLRDYYLPNEEPITGDTLSEICKNSQIKILSLMISDDDREALMTIVNALKTQKTNDTVIQTIVKTFDLRI